MESSRRLGNEPECRCKPTLHIWQAKAAKEAEQEEEEEQKWHHHHLHANPKKGVNPNPRISQMARNHAVSCNCRRLQLQPNGENARKCEKNRRYQQSATDDAEELQSMQRVNSDTRV